MESHLIEVTTLGDLFYIGTAQAKPWVAASRGMSVLDAALYTNATLALDQNAGVSLAVLPSLLC